MGNLNETQQVQDYEDIVASPGKFGGEARYVPYFWEFYLDGFYDDDDSEVLTFTIANEDRKIFRELAGRDTVKLYERSDGFVIEV